MENCHYMTDYHDTTGTAYNAILSHFPATTTALEVRSLMLYQLSDVLCAMHACQAGKNCCLCDGCGFVIGS